MVHLGTYEFNNLNTVKIISEEIFKNDYTEEIYGSEKVRTSTKRLNVILNNKYERGTST